MDTDLVSEAVTSLSDEYFPFVRPIIPKPDKWVSHLDIAYDRRYFTNFGPAEQTLTQSIQDEFAQKGHCCILTCNATVALSASLIAQDITGKVVLPAFTFPATIQAVIAAGCEPVICDVDPVTWELSANDVQTFIDQEGAPAALMPVRPFGFVRPMHDIIAIAKDYSIPIVVDAAAAIGATRFPFVVDTDVPIIEVFSLHATKSFGIGEGGVIVAPERLKQQLRSALNFGLQADRNFSVGSNGKMSEFQAAVGLGVMETLGGLIKGRERMYEAYTRFAASRPKARLACDIGPCPYTNFPILLPEGANTEQIEKDALAIGVQVRRYYHPSLADNPLLSLSIKRDCPTSSNLAARMICLPLYADATTAETDEIVRRVEAVFNRHGA